MDWSEIISKALSILSMLLSIGNTFFIYFWTSRVHLNLDVENRIACSPYATKTDDRILYWRISNVSTFPVYIEELGFCDSRNNECVKVSSPFVRKQDKQSEEIEFPYKLNSREGITFRVEHSSQTEEMNKHTHMYVKTCCGYFKAAKVPPFTYSLI